VGRGAGGGGWLRFRGEGVGAGVSFFIKIWGKKLNRWNCL